MKKKILVAALLAVFVLSVGLVALVGCNPDDITYFRLDLNDKDADYTQEYREANSIESRNIIKVVNKDLYKNFSTGLPKGSDMVAPSGKVFAGWYFDNTNFEGTEFSEYNWNKFQRDAADDEKKYVLYARWIPQGQQVIYFDLNNDKADFTDSFRTAHSNFTHRTPEFVINNDLAQKAFSMPQEVNLLVPSEVTFDGWYFADDNTELTPANYVAHVEAGAVQMRVVAHWNNKPKATMCVNLPEAEDKIFYFTDEAIARYTGYSSQTNLSETILCEDYEGLLALLPTKEDIYAKVYEAGVETEVRDIVESIDGFEIVSWDDNGTEITVPLTKLTWEAATQYDGAYVYLRPILSLKAQ